jgi:flagellar biosynthesis protein FliR
VVIGFAGLILPFAPPFTHQAIPVVAGIGIALVVSVALSLAMKRWPATNWKPPRTAAQVVIVLLVVILARVLVHSTSVTSIWGSVAAGISWALGLRLWTSARATPQSRLPK